MNVKYQLVYGCVVCTKKEPRELSMLLCIHMDQDCVLPAHVGLIVVAMYIATHGGHA